MKDKLASKVWRRIEKEEIRIKPRWWFEAQYLGIKITNWLVMAGVAGVVAYLFSRIEIEKPQEWLEFGEIGREIIIEEYKNILGGLITAGVVGFVISRNLGSNYKKTLGKSMIYFGLTVILTAITMTLLRWVYELEWIGWFI